jgi:simple sugar transport system ATP-binding protein
VTTGAPDTLVMTGVSRRFGPVQALDGASLTVRPGTVHAVLGENGAGKSTLMRVAFGMVRPDAGRIRLFGAPVAVRSPAEARALGIGMVHQHFSLVPAMTVAENVALGGRGRFDPAAATARVRDLAARAGLAIDPSARVATLPIGAQQRCEILKALAGEARLLILDEPTAVLAPGEARELLQWVRRHADAGHAVVLITHKLRDALAIADDVTVLRRGRTVLAARAADCDEPMLAAAMIGDADGSANAGAGGTTTGGTARAARATPPQAPPILPTGADLSAAPRHAAVGDGRVPGAPVLQATALTLRDARGVELVRDASLTVHAGEIVALVAIEGAGQHELLRALAGRRSADAGTIVSPAELGFVPEDRHRDALLLDASLVENVALRGAGARRGRMPWAALADATRRILAARDVRAASEQATARSLSGGNQQKLVLGRELEGRPAAIIVENPSRGLDFLATRAVQAALRAAREEGAAVLLYSSDLDEALALADRVLVLQGGQVREVPRDRDHVGRAMLGAA